VDGTQDVLLRPKEVAAAFRVSTRTLQRWENAGLIRGTRTLGGQRRYWRSEVERALQTSNARAN
jgi:excisionase family DNA binding protein